MSRLFPADNSIYFALLQDNTPSQHIGKMLYNPFRNSADSIDWNHKQKASKTMTLIDAPQPGILHVVTADLNRRAGYGMVKVSLRRFGDVLPEVGESVILVDGEDKLYAAIETVDREQRVVLVRITTW